MQSAIEILKYADATGITIRAEGDRVKVGGHYTPEFLETAKQHKADLIVMLRITEACRGYQITPEQFYALTTEEDREDIRTGKSPIEHLRWYAASFAEGIQSGRIKFHPTTGQLARHN